MKKNDNRILKIILYSEVQITCRDLLENMYLSSFSLLGFCWHEDCRDIKQQFFILMDTFQKTIILQLEVYAAK